MLGRLIGKGFDKMVFIVFFVFFIYYMVEGGKCVFEGFEFGGKEIN